MERDPGDRRVLRITGRADIHTDPAILRPFNLRVALKYLLTPADIVHQLKHLRQRHFVRDYHRQNAKKGRPCLIVVVPERVELLH